MFYDNGTWRQTGNVDSAGDRDRGWKLEQSKVKVLGVCVVVWMHKNARNIDVDFSITFNLK